MAIFILVSGAWHAGWCWERIAPLLEKGGHEVLAPDLLGMGGDKTPLSSVSLAMWADQIAALTEAQTEPVVLVGHSRGGIVISEAAERVPRKIKTLVYLTAYLLPSGKSILTASAEQSETALVNSLMPGPQGGFVIREDSIMPLFYNTTAPSWVERAKSLLTEEPTAPSDTVLNLTPERFGSVRRAYIECTRDEAIPLARQRSMQADLPCDPVVTLDADHSPFYSMPTALADCLSHLANQTDE